MHGNDQDITRFGGFRETVTRMDIKDSRAFRKYYKDQALRYKLSEQSEQLLSLYGLIIVQRSSQQSENR